MAKRLRDEEIRLSIIINGNKAQKEIIDLEKRNRNLTQTIKEQKQELKEVARQYGRNSVQYKKLTGEIRQNELAFKQNRIEIGRLEDELKITDMTMAQMQRRASVLRASLRNMAPNTAPYKAMNAELGQLKTRIAQLNGQANRSKLSFGKAADWLNRYQGLVLGVAASITGLVFGIQQWIDFQGKMSDKMSDVRKTTGMTNEEVKELSKSFGALATRTSRINLLQIAEEGGRIGIAKEEIQDFVKIMDKAVVALSDEFPGGAAETVKSLGIIKGLFEQTKDLDVNEAYNAIGSAVNELGADGAATAPNLAEFTKRVGSMQEELKPTVAEALGLGAALEQSGIKADIGSRAYSIFIGTASKKIGAFAQQMGKSKAEVKEMINTDAVGFFLEFSESLKGMEGTEAAQVLNDLGLSADGVKKIVGAAAANTELFQDKIDLANQSMLEGTSLLNEYNIKNSNFAALIDKISKTMRGWLNSEKLTTFLYNAIELFGKLIGATEDADGSAKKLQDRFMIFIKVLTIATVAVLSYKSAIVLSELWTRKAAVGTRLFDLAIKAKTATMATARAAILAFKLVLSLTTLSLAKVRAAWLAFSAAMALNPLGAVLAVLGAIVTTIVLFADKTEKAANNQSILNDVMAEANKSTAKQRAELASLVKVARDENISKENRIKAIRKLNEISPEYLGNLSLETINTKEATKAINAYVGSLSRKAKATALQSQLEKAYAEQSEIEKKKYVEYLSNFEKISGKTALAFGGYTAKGGLEVNNLEDFAKLKAQERKAAELYKTQSRIDLIESQLTGSISDGSAEYDNLFADDSSNASVTNAINRTVTSTRSPSSSVGRTRKAKSNIDEKKRQREQEIGQLRNLAEKEAAELLKLQREFKDLELDIMDDGFAKQKAKLEVEFEYKQQQLQDEFNLTSKSIEVFSEKRKKAIAKGDVEKVKLLDENIALSLKKQGELEVQSIQLRRRHEQRKLTIANQFITKEFQTKQESFDREKKQRDTAFQEELNSLNSLDAAKQRLANNLSSKELARIKTLADAKEALENRYNQQEKERQIAQLKELQVEMQSLISSEEWQGIDLDLLTDEQKQKMLDYIDELKSKVAELKAQISGDSTANQDGTANANFNSGDTDVLGMTTDQWSAIFNNFKGIEDKIGATIGLIGAMQNAFGQYYSFIQANEQRNFQAFESGIDRKQQRLQQQLDQGYISQKNFDKLTSQLEDERNRKQAEYEYKSAKREKKMAIASTVMNTAQAIMRIWARAPEPITATILTGMVSALGALKIATIAKQPLPARGFEDGLYDNLMIKREQDGKLFKAKYGGETRSGLVSRPTYFRGPGGSGFLAGERSTTSNPEMIIDDKAWRQLSPELKADLQSEIARVKGFEEGFYDLKNKTIKSTTGDSNALLITTLAKTNKLLEILEEEGVQAIISNRDLRSMKRLKEGINDFENLEQKNKV